MEKYIKPSLEITVLDLEQPILDGSPVTVAVDDENTTNFWD